MSLATVSASLSSRRSTTRSRAERAATSRRPDVRAPRGFSPIFAEEVEVADCVAVFDNMSSRYARASDESANSMLADDGGVIDHAYEAELSTLRTNRLVRSIMQSNRTMNAANTVAV